METFQDGDDALLAPTTLTNSQELLPEGESECMCVCGAWDSKEEKKTANLSKSSLKVKTA